jgi:cytochrome c oxidase subunit 3
MSIIILFLAAILSAVGWWFWRQGIGSKPWLHVGVLAGSPGANAPVVPAAKTGLGVFLVVAGCLFALVVSAYSMRMQMGDWWPMPVPGILWVNTGILVMSSVALGWARVSCRNGAVERMRVGLISAFLFALVFLAGQVAAWRELAAAGYTLSSNPANSFFYLITGAHGLHVLGGLFALGRTTEAGLSTPAARGARDLLLRIDLCDIYWHFLLLVWLILLALLAGWAGEFMVICRQLLT